MTRLIADSDCCGALKESSIVVAPPRPKSYVFFKKVMCFSNSYSTFGHFYERFEFFSPSCIHLFPFFEEEREINKIKISKGEPLQKLAGFWREFDLFLGNFRKKLAFSNFPTFPIFFKNSTKIRVSLRSF